MLNKIQHRQIMTNILKDIYTDIEISSLLGFKGGTVAYFFYQLPRFSVDLDLDLLKISSENKELVFSKIERIIKKYGKIKDNRIKRFTIFSLLSYGSAEHNIKIEISTRKNNNKYELRKYLGISMLVAKKETLFANKLAALCNRKEIAMRDIYDIYYFTKNHWDIDEDVLKFWTGNSISKQLGISIKFIEKISDNSILKGLGEVLEDKEKVWARENLKKEVLFALRNYKESLKS
ncbi:nucleotidyl transferase AbiEii/AbiGii toxin family protein [Patescibacteria group bacterium]